MSHLAVARSIPRFELVFPPFQSKSPIHTFALSDHFPNKLAAEKPCFQENKLGTNLNVDILSYKNKNILVLFIASKIEKILMSNNKRQMK